MVLQQPSAALNTWKVVEAELNATGITVLRARLSLRDSLAKRSSAQSREEGSSEGSVSEMLGNLNGTTVTLVPDSARSVCRLLDIAAAAPEQLKHMVALRLELELPYPVADSVWVCEEPQQWREPGTNGDGTIPKVLVIAAAAEDIALAESELRNVGVRDGVAMEFAAGGLAELAADASHQLGEASLRAEASPSTNASGPANGTAAIANLDGDEATLAIAHHAALCYSRNIRVGPVASGGQGLAQLLGQELRQSIYDYTLRTGNGAPVELLVTGELMGDEDLVGTLTEHLGIPVKPMDCPDLFDLPKPELVEGDLLADYPVLAGVLISMRRRMLGQPAAAPPLRRRRRRFGTMDLGNRRVQLFGLNAVALLLFAASLFGVQALRLDSADRLMRESQPLLQSLERHREEVDILQYEAGRRRPVLDTMMALSEALPKEIKVETLTIDSRGKISIGGKAKSVEMASDTAIAALRASTFFVNPQFNGATREKEEFSFQITCELRGGRRGIRK